MACLGLPPAVPLFFGRRGIPARVDEIVLRIGCADRRGEAEELRRLRAACCGRGAKLRVAAQRLWANVGGKEQRVPLFQAEVCGTRIAIERLAIAQDRLIDGEQRVLIRLDSGGIARDRGVGHEAARTRKIFQPVETPFDRTHNAVGVTRGERGFPCEHPSRVELSKHYTYRS